jgi:NADP-dependent 3-hydroxy acid dehydrogenase YdfG
MKTIFITGATAGFGAAFARRFVQDGHRVIATGRRVERLWRSSPPSWASASCRFSWT